MLKWDNRRMNVLPLSPFDVITSVMINHQSPKQEFSNPRLVAKRIQKREQVSGVPPCSRCRVQIASDIYGTLYQTKAKRNACKKIQVLRYSSLRTAWLSFKSFWLQAFVVFVVMWCHQFMMWTVRQILSDVLLPSKSCCYSLYIFGVTWWGVGVESRRRKPKKG